MDNLTNYVNIYIKNTTVWENNFYPIPKKLLKDEISFDEINDNDLQEIYKSQKNEYFDNVNYYSTILKEYLESIGCKIE